MIENGIVNRLTAATCAIGWLRETRDRYIADPLGSVFEIEGTGFLISRRTVVTNRHVLQAVSSIIKKRRLPPDRLCVQFTYPAGEAINQTLFIARKSGYVTDPKEIDIAFIDLDLPEDPNFEACQPPSLQKGAAVRVGEPVAAVGYAFGSRHLRRSASSSGKQYRFGPVLQQGFVSAIAPYDGSPRVDRLLLDIRTSPGMSGSPVFRPATGEVLAIHDAGREATTAFAIPITEPMMDALLRVHLETGIGSSLKAEVPLAKRL